jgi:hypothetical protein
MRKLVVGLLACVWLAVVAASVYLVVTRRNEYGHFTYIVPGMAVFMLVLFVLAFLPRKGPEPPLRERLGLLSVGALILFALAVLGVAIIQRRGDLVGLAVLGLFFVVFVRIFAGWMKHYRGLGKKRWK